MEQITNQGKKLKIEIDNEIWERHPIKTHFVVPQDKIEDIVEKYVLPIAKPGDIIGLGQKIVSIIQNKIIYKKDLKISFWAKFLSRFVTKTPYGFSVGNPLKMQVAINVSGLPRVIFAGIIGFVGRIFGIRGLFYRLVGHQVSELDGFYGEAFPQYAEMGILGPDKCDELCESLKEKYNFSFAVVDVNDIGGNVLGRSKDLSGKEKLIVKILKDNPAGQGEQMTPIIILRRN